MLKLLEVADFLNPVTAARRFFIGRQPNWVPDKSPAVRNSWTLKEHSTMKKFPIHTTGTIELDALGRRPEWGLAFRKKQKVFPRCNTDLSTAVPGAGRGFFYRVCSVLLLVVADVPGAMAQRPADSDWSANAVVAEGSQFALTGVGAAQGVSMIDGFIYVYGDATRSERGTGVISELDADLQPTGRTLLLNRGGRPLLDHPTGLTRHPSLGFFMGNTSSQKAKIFRLDWDRAWRDGNLDNAVLAVIDDDAAINGCRPEFVRLGDRDLLATADYGDARPEVRLMDVEAMLKHGRTSAPGVVTNRFLAGPFNQTLSFDATTGDLLCVQNVVEGLGWQIERLDLEKAVADGRGWGPEVLLERLVLFPHSELEGYCQMPGQRSLWITSWPRNNLTLGKIRKVPERMSAAGEMQISPLEFSAERTP